MKVSHNTSVKLIKYSLILSILAVQFGCKSRTGKTEEKANLTSYVNPFLGTAPLTDTNIIGYTPPEGWRVWAGLTYPGSSLPNAMVQLSPITEFGSGAGYEYEDNEIYGFTIKDIGIFVICLFYLFLRKQNFRLSRSFLTQMKRPRQDFTRCF